jgi:Protein of unknown function (DUF5818)
LQKKSVSVIQRRYHVKKLAVVFAFASISAMAADWTGTIMDTKCSSNKAMRENAACAEKCIKGGSPAVLVTDDGTVYKIADQDKVVAHAGHKVTITGTMDGDTIRVESVKM